MGEIRKILVSWGVVALAIILAAKTAFELYTLARSPGENIQEYLWTAFYWFLLFVVAIAGALFIREWELRNIKNERPIIKIEDFGIHPKEWVDLPPTATAFVLLKNKPYPGAIDANAMDVYPEVIWEDENGKEVERNSGRWFISNRNKPGRENIKTADLLANGEPQLFHFAISEAQNMIIKALWRNEDDKLKTKPLVSSDSYKITIVLTDNGNLETKFFFRISLFRTNDPPYKALKLEKISKRGKIEGIKEFNFNNLNISNSPAPIQPMTQESTAENYDSFSRHLDNLTTGKKFSGPSIIFLRNIKVFPPFLETV